MASSKPRGLLQRFFKTLNGAGKLQGKPFKDPTLIRPNFNRKLINVSHYGIMIPNLPEPFRFFSLMAIIGTAGNRFIDTDHMLVDIPRRNATQVSGTAAPGTDQFGSYSIDRDCDIHLDGSLIQFGQDVILSGLYPDIRLQINRAGFELDITLHCHDNVTWFMYSPLYKHLGLMADYSGFINYRGQRYEISGPCTYEYFTMAGPYGFIKRPLPRMLKVPTDFFTYQIVHIDNDTQLMLAKVSASGKTIIEAAFIRGRDDHSRTYAQSTHFEITRFEDEMRVAPDGRSMQLPQAFTWTVQDGERDIAIINGTIDTPFIYGLCSGYVGGYYYEGEFAGQAVSGRAYIEYVDVM
jgi:hypothetical protein